LPAIQESLKTIIHQSRTFESRLFDPLDPALHWQKRLLNYLLVPAFILLVLQSSWSGSASGYLAYIALNFAVIVLAYLLNRRGSYLAGALTLCLLISASSFVLFFLRVVEHVPVPDLALMRIFPAILIAYLVLPLRWMLALALVNLTATLAIGIAAPGVYAYVFTVFAFTLIITGLMAVAAVSRNRYIMHIEQQTQELGESEARFRNLLEASFEIILVHKDSVILDTNAAVETLLGYKPAEVIGKSTLDFVEPTYHKRLIESYQSGSTEPIQVLLRHKNGSLLQADARRRDRRFCDARARGYRSPRRLPEHRRGE